MFQLVLEPSALTAMPKKASIQVRLQRPDGSSKTVQVEPGTTAAVILEREAQKLPTGYWVAVKELK